MDPLVKWAGGKRQLLDRIISLLPKDVADRPFHEPMIGGGALFFHLEPDKGSINDVNPHLIRFYKAVRDNPDDLIESARSHVHDEDYYYDARDRYNQDDTLTDVEKAALFLYFNRTGFNGLWRVNSDGEYNVPFGDYQNPTIVDEEAIYDASELLSGIDLRNGDFEYILKQAEPGDVVYFDPPYQPVSDTADFTEYTKGGFDKEDQERLFETTVSLDEQGTVVVLSNSYARHVRELYESHDGFDVKAVKALRVINSKGDSRGPVKEILVHNTDSVGLQRWD